MVVVLIVALVLSAAIGVAYLQYRMKQARIAALKSLAGRLGLSFSLGDPGDVLALPFSLLNAGDGRGVENFITGQQEGRPLGCFDYWYCDESTDSKGRRSRTYHRFTCALLTMELSAPHLRLGHEGFFSRIGNALGIDDVELEYEEFNREFRVKCDDQRFAFSLFDGQMMEWLLTAPRFEVMEIGGSHALLAHRRLPPEEWPSLPALMEELRAHIPHVVFTSYPGA